MPSLSQLVAAALCALSSVSAKPVAKREDSNLVFAHFMVRTPLEREDTRRARG